MRLPHWSEALSVLHVEGSWRGTLAEKTMTTFELDIASIRDRALLDYPWKETRKC